MGVCSVLLPKMVPSYPLPQPPQGVYLFRPGQLRPLSKAVSETNSHPFVFLSRFLIKFSNILDARSCENLQKSWEGCTKSLFARNPIALPFWVRSACARPPIWTPKSSQKVISELRKPGSQPHLFFKLHFWCHSMLS